MSGVSGVFSGPRRRSSRGDDDGDEADDGVCGGGDEADGKQQEEDDEGGRKIYTRVYVCKGYTSEFFISCTLLVYWKLNRITVAFGT